MSAASSMKMMNGKPLNAEKFANPKKIERHELTRIYTNKLYIFNYVCVILVTLLKLQLQWGKAIIWL